MTTAHCTTALEQIIAERLSVAEAVLAAFELGLCRGMAVPYTRALSPTLAALLETVEARWHTEFEAEMEADPPMRADAIPGWLLAHAERRQLPSRPRQFASGPQPLPASDFLARLAEESREREASLIRGEP